MMEKVVFGDIFDEFDAWKRFSEFSNAQFPMTVTEVGRLLSFRWNTKLSWDGSKPGIEVWTGAKGFPSPTSVVSILFCLGEVDSGWSRSEDWISTSTTFPSRMAPISSHQLGAPGSSRLWMGQNQREHHVVHHQLETPEWWQCPRLH